MSRIALMTVLTILALTAAASAESAHSGRIVAIDEATRTITLEELGPAPGETPAPATRTVELSPETRVELYVRAEGAGEADWPGGFAAKPLAPADLRPGDFATVRLEGAAGRPRALAVAVVRPEP